MPKSLHAFVDLTELSFRIPRLPGYPEKVPGHLLIADVVARPEKNDVDTIVTVFGVSGVRAVLQNLVEKGLITPISRDEVQAMLAEKEADGNLYRTL